MSVRLRRALMVCLALTLAFYLWQNLNAAQGGALALPKALWLGLTVFYWLLLPALVFCRRPAGVSPRLARAYSVFWLPMFGRAVAELWLLYGSGSWQYAYGIAHDAFSLVLLAALAWHCRHCRPRPLLHTLWVMAAMFAAEIQFARYIAAFNTGTDRAELWFIGWQAPHLANQLFTSVLVAALAAWLLFLYRRLP